MFTTRNNDENDRSSEEVLMLSKLVESQEARLQKIEATRNQQQLLETQAHNQQQMLEALTASFSKGLLEVLNHQNKVLANSIGEKKLNSDDEVDKEEKEFA
ncbi:hypothetical protein MKW94_011006, partial [Papaver nudicaule]|nr:hypothetical protein [Papaver nudicaule]